MLLCFIVKIVTHLLPDLWLSDVAWISWFSNYFWRVRNDNTSLIFFASVRPFFFFACKISRNPERILLKFDIAEFCQNLSLLYNFDWRQSVSNILHEDFCVSVQESLTGYYCWDKWHVFRAQYALPINETWFMLNTLFL